MDFEFDATTEDLRARVRDFLESEITPAEQVFEEQLARSDDPWAWSSVPVLRELKDKVGGVIPGSLTPVAAAMGAAQDAVSALLNLGFRPAEANAAVGAAEEELGASASLDALVRLALRKAAK